MFSQAQLKKERRIGSKATGNHDRIATDCLVLADLNDGAVFIIGLSTGTYVISVRLARLVLKNKRVDLSTKKDFILWLKF
jgi:hypothetical protein